MLLVAMNKTGLSWRLRADGCGPGLVRATAEKKFREDSEFFFAGLICSSFISFN